MAISYYDFSNIPKESQHELVMAEGKVINEIFKNELKFVLYEVSSFSVEIVFNMVNNKIVSLSVFQNKGLHGK